MDGGDDCKTMLMFLMAMNCTPKNGKMIKMVSFMYILLQFFKKPYDIHTPTDTMYFL